MAPLPVAHTESPPLQYSQTANHHSLSLCLCLRFSQLPLYALGCRADDKQVRQLVVEQQRVVAAPRALLAMGIQLGMTASHVHMLAPDIECLPRKIPLEQALLQQLAHWAYAYSPLISIYQQSLLLDIGGCLRLFGGFNKLLEGVKADLRYLGMVVEPGIAHTPKAAYLLSFEKNNGMQAALRGPLYKRRALQIIGQAGVESLDNAFISARVLGQLQGCGFECLQEIMDIPAAELGQRFGKGFLDYLARLLGNKPDPQPGIVPPETFYQQRDFSQPVHNQQWIDQVVSELLQQLCDFLRQRQLHCQGFSWHFYADQNQLLHTVMISLAAKQNAHKVFKQLTDLQLEKLQLKNELMRIELSSEKLLPIALLSDDFFDPSIDQDEALQLIDKLIARMGPQAVYQLHIKSEHLPELRNKRQTINSQSASKDEYLSVLDSSRCGALLQSQPVWLLSKPQPITEDATGYPLAIEGGRAQWPLQIIHGPHRIVSHWWRRNQRRDYFIARQRDGRLLWVFFDLGLQRWFLHGFFG